MNPRRNRVFGVPASDHPLADRAIGVLHVDVQPGVRVDPFHLGNRAAQMDRLLRVELSLKGVMRPQAHGQQKPCPNQKTSQFLSHRCSPYCFDCLAASAAAALSWARAPFRRFIIP